MATDQQSGAPPAVEAPWPASNGIWASYDLHCHCGSVRYSMKVSPPLFEQQTEGKEQYTVIECHCSHCERQGALCVHPLVENIEWTQGVEHRGTYLCASKKSPHFFCKNCGCFLATDLSWLMENVFKSENRMSMNVSRYAWLSVGAYHCEGLLC